MRTRTDWIHPLTRVELGDLEAAADRSAATPLTEISRADFPLPTFGRKLEAMHLLESLAAGDELRLDMDFRPGDIQVLHNHQILHARTDYQDHPEPERRRHLLRLWLSARNGRVLPAVFAERYGEIGVGKRRGGIRVPGAALTVPLYAA